MSRNLRSFRFGKFVLEQRLQRLLRSSEIVLLKPKAYDLLCVLIANRDRLMTKEELLDWLWPRQDIGEANLSQTVYELRRALGESARKPRWIETAQRRGYRFVGDVVELGAATHTELPRSIAVLPFRGLTDEASVRELGLGIADSIILSLGTIRRVVVRPLSAVLGAPAEGADALSIGRALDVDAVLEGTIQRIGERLRIGARLLRTDTGGDLCTLRHDVDCADLFITQDRIAVQVAEAVAPELSPAERKLMARRPPDDPEVYALYLKARYCWHRWSPAASRQAIEFLQAATALDPGHAASHAWLAAAWATLGFMGGATPTDAAARARKSAGRAVELDGSQSVGFEMLGAIELFFDWDLSAAGRSLDRAIELSPDSSNAHHLRALVLAIGGHDDAAQVEILRALQADPSSLIANTDVGMIHYWGRRYEEARRWLETTLEQEPGFSHARFGLAFVLLELELEELAVKEIERAVETSGREASGEVAYVLGRAGRHGDARRILARLQQPASAADPYQIMLGHLGLGDDGQTFQWLDRSLAYRNRELAFMAVNPIFDRVRTDARFRGFVRKAGLGELGGTTGHEGAERPAG